MPEFEMSDIDLPTEQLLLGALLQDNSVHGEITGLTAGDFADPLHALIFAAAVNRIEAGEAVTAATLKPEFETSGDLDEIGGVNYLDQLLACEIDRAHAREYGCYLHALAKIRNHNGERCANGNDIEISLLKEMLDFFDAPQKWLRSGWADESGARCLVGAYIYHRTQMRIADDQTLFFLSRAILRRYQNGTLFLFNDRLCADFAELRATIRDAHDLAEGKECPLPT